MRRIQEQKENVIQLKKTWNENKNMKPWCLVLNFLDLIDSNLENYTGTLEVIISSNIRFYLTHFFINVIAVFVLEIRDSRCRSAGATSGILGHVSMARRSGRIEMRFRVLDKREALIADPDRFSAISFRTHSRTIWVSLSSSVAILTTHPKRLGRCVEHSDE